ncbi:MAG: hypothetical protein KF893_25580 [Caldilineaceae bacterium]|nr:hypothetical protein [Caldilineaceae bacterium]
MMTSNREQLREQSIKQWNEFTAYVDRLEAWRKILKPLPSHTADSIADLLSRLGYEPDEDGIPRGEIPPISRMDPRAYLHSLSTRVLIGDRPDSVDARQSTNAWKADVLEAAILVHYGLLPLDHYQIQEVCPRASLGDVVGLLMVCDMEKFLNRQGYTLTREKATAKWNRGERLLDEDSLKDMFRNFKGGT